VRCCAAGLPPLNAVLLLLAACRDSWQDSAPGLEALVSLLRCLDVPAAPPFARPARIGKPSWLPHFAVALATAPGGYAWTLTAHRDGSVLDAFSPASRSRDVWSLPVPLGARVWRLHDSAVSLMASLPCAGRKPVAVLRTTHLHEFALLWEDGAVRRYRMVP